MPFATDRVFSPRFVPAILAVAVVAAALVSAPGGARAAATRGAHTAATRPRPLTAGALYQDPFSGEEPYVGRTDGDNAGRYVYVAEQITNLARIGQTVRAGDVVARYARKGTCIETGWSTATGATLAQATTGYTEGDVTVAGVSFARFLISLGVPGTFDLVPAHATRSRPTKKHRGHRRPRT
jgi:hypothetical protein